MLKPEPTLYDGIEEMGLSLDLQGWHSDHPIFKAVIEEVKPSVIVEVGSWKGASAIHMAKLTDDIRSTIVCVDTWLGGIDHFVSKLPQDQITRVKGWPQLYFQFLHNVKVSGCADRILPIPQTSANGARFLRNHVSPSLIYVDGSHEYEDVWLDLQLYWPILARGGIMFGDDFRGFPGVFAAVVRFGAEIGQQPVEVDNHFWVFRKA